jgi:hypothetical protein
VREGTSVLNTRVVLREGDEVRNKCPKYRSCPEGRRCPDFRECVHLGVLAVCGAQT